MLGRRSRASYALALLCGLLEGGGRNLARDASSPSYMCLHLPPPSPPRHQVPYVVAPDDDVGDFTDPGAGAAASDMGREHGGGGGGGLTPIST